MDGLRTLLFRIVFYGGSVPIVLLSPVAALFGEKFFRNWVVFWTAFHAWCARNLMGIRIRIAGARPTTPALYAAKHNGRNRCVAHSSLAPAPASGMGTAARA